MQTMWFACGACWRGLLSDWLAHSLIFHQDCRHLVVGECKITRLNDRRRVDAFFWAGFEVVLGKQYKFLVENTDAMREAISDNPLLFSDEVEKVNARGRLTIGADFSGHDK